MDSPYYSESELCGSAVTVSFLKYLPWQVMQFLQRSTHFENVLQTVCRKLQEDSGTGGFDLLITLTFLALELSFHWWKSPEITWGEMWTVW